MATVSRALTLVKVPSDIIKLKKVCLTIILHIFTMCQKTHIARKKKCKYLIFKDLKFKIKSKV